MKIDRSKRAVREVNISSLNSSEEIETELGTATTL